LEEKFGDIQGWTEPYPRRTKRIIGVTAAAFLRLMWIPVKTAPKQTIISKPNLWPGNRLPKTIPLIRAIRSGTIGRE
jgi:hypothetical protein